MDNLIEIWIGKLVIISNNLKKKQNKKKSRHKNSKSIASKLKTLCANLSPTAIFISPFLLTFPRMKLYLLGGSNEVRKLWTTSALSPGTKVQGTHIGYRGQSPQIIWPPAHKWFSANHPLLCWNLCLCGVWRKPENPACLPSFWQFNLGIILAFHKLLTKKCVLYFDHATISQAQGKEALCTIT